MKYLLHIVLFIRYRLFFFCCCCLLFSSCSNEGYFYPIPPQPEKETQRIIIAYLAGDNSLSSEIEQKIAALTVGFLSADYSQNRLFIYYDRKHVSPQLLEISADTETPRQILKTYTTQNSASAEVMKQVLNDILKNYSASSYGLILFSHGSAWLPAGGLEEPYKGENLEKGDIDSSRRSTRSVCTDGESEMELTDFAAALPLPGNKKWDFILFEGCYMGSVEVAYELKDKTEAIIASPTEIVSPGMTEVYPSALPYLFQPTPGLEKFAKPTSIHGIAKREITVRLLSALCEPDIWKNWHSLPVPLFCVGSRMPEQFLSYSVLTATNGICSSTLKKHC